MVWHRKKIRRTYDMCKQILLSIGYQTIDLFTNVLCKQVGMCKKYDILSHAHCIIIIHLFDGQHVNLHKIINENLNQPNKK